MSIFGFSTRGSGDSKPMIYTPLPPPPPLPTLPKIVLHENKDKSSPITKEKDKVHHSNIYFEGKNHHFFTLHQHHLQKVITSNNHPINISSTSEKLQGMITKLLYPFGSSFILQFHTIIY
jgi:hypothetical protein